MVTPVPVLAPRLISLLAVVAVRIVFTVKVIVDQSATLILVPGVPA